MSLPRNLTRYQEHILPQNQGVTGACTGAGTSVAAMACLINVQNILVPQLSWGFSYALTGDTTFSVGSNPVSVIALAADKGLCTEALYSQSTVLNNWQGGAAYPAYALPQPAAYADALTRKVTKWAIVAANPGTINMDWLDAILDAGYPVTFCRGNHEMCLIARDNRYYAMNSRAADTDMGAGFGVSIFPRESIVDRYSYGFVTVQEVQTAGAPPITFPPPTGNTQMLIDSIKADANGLVLYQVTQAQVDKIKADVAQLVADAGTSFPVVTIVNGNFELPSVGTFQYNPPTTAGVAWVFAGGCGVSKNGTGFTSDNPPAPTGSQVAFMQGTSAKIAQSVSITAAGNYTLSFKAAQRGSSQLGYQIIVGKVDAAAVGQYQPPDKNYSLYTTAPFALTTGSHTVELSGAGAGSDFTALVDDVKLTKV